METLVIYNNGLYLLPPGLGDPYLQCHGCILGMTDSGKDAYDRTEHLGYMLGVEKWYDVGGVPELPAFLQRIAGEETADSDTRECQPAPWARYKISGQTVDLTFGRIQVVVCNWPE